jgi:hypothetical protein
MESFMPDQPGKPALRVLSPMERIGEALFGLIMAMTITGALSVAEAGKADVNTMMVTALGCNLAWGIIDAGMYLMNCLGVRGHGIITLRRMRDPIAPAEGQRLVADALPPIVASVMTPEQLETIRQRLIDLRDTPGQAGLTGRDWLGALGVFLIVFLSTFPIVIPFIVLDDVRHAMRLSNAVGVVMLFLAGYAFGRHAGLGGWVMGVAMVVIGIILVVMTIALGG